MGRPVRRFLVTGCTHLGIRGLYGEKEFEAVDENHLLAGIAEDRNIPSDALRSSYKLGKRTVFVFQANSKPHTTLFEFYYEELPKIKSNVPLSGIAISSNAIEELLTKYEAELEDNRDGKDLRPSWARQRKEAVIVIRKRLRELVNRETS